MITRRIFSSALLLTVLPGARILAATTATTATSAAPGTAPRGTPPASRKLPLRVNLEGFGGTNESDLKAVLRSAADEIWQHCPNTRFEAAGFEIYHREKTPITQHERSRAGGIVVGLAAEGYMWSRYAYQFAHEFCHALISHSNDWRRLWRKTEHANQWLDEAFCETASLFSLRAMARTWQTHPPYRNWKSYAPSLASYAQTRMDDPKHRLPAATSFADWFAAELPGLRKAWSQREKNTLIAQQLLPLFEAQPQGWESLTALKLGSRDVDKSPAKQLTEWHANAPAEQRAFVERITAVFGVKLAARKAAE